MEELKNIDLTNLTQFLREVNPLYWAIAGGVLFVLILVPIIARSIKKSKANKVKPELVLHSFQISPLGKDAWLRLRNEGQLAVLKDMKFKKRNDIEFKTNFREVKIANGNTAGLFLHAKSHERIREDFEIEMLYADSLGYVYKQLLRLDGRVMMQAKLQ